MPCLECTSWDLHGSRIGPVYQSKPKLDFGPQPIYESKSKTSFKPGLWVGRWIKCPFTFLHQRLHPYEIISAPAVRNSIYGPNTCFHGVPNKNCHDELELGLIIKIYLTPAQVIYKLR